MVGGFRGEWNAPGKVLFFLDGLEFVGAVLSFVGGVLRASCVGLLLHAQRPAREMIRYGTGGNLQW
jgi:hypothetical protein